MTKNKKALIYITLFMFVILAIPQKALALSHWNTLTSQKKNTQNMNTQNMNTQNNTEVVVTFNPTGGTVKTSDKAVTFRTSYGSLPSATKENYEFDGWYLFESGGFEITEDSIVGKNIPHTLYAHWQGHPVDITLNSNGGELNQDTITVYYGSKYQLPNPRKTNCTFDGWYTALKGGDRINLNSIFDEKSTKTLYAHWSEVNLKITFIGYNGSVYYKNILSGNKLGALPKPKKKGYVFGGWYTWEDYSNPNAEPISKNTTVDTSTSLNFFARWY